MDLDVVFLGTSGSAPSAQRAPSALLVRRGADRLLVDCGEGTQRQLLRSTVGLPDLEEIFLTHFHADHFLGLPGMLKTFALRGREETPLTVYGPRGLRDLFSRLRPFVGRLPYPLSLVELAPGERVERGDYRVETFAVEHGISALGYLLAEDERPGEFDAAAADALGVPFGPERGLLQRGEAVTLADGRVVAPTELIGAPRRGRRLAFTGDTAASPAIVQAAYEADLLVHEATFLAEEAERARDTQHATAAEAAETARLARVRLLALTHVSTRYAGGELEREARETFPDTVVPRDFDVVEIPFPERGAPRLVKKGARPPRGEPAAPMIEPA
ncbi:MAG TPA: ribonuclease Z [Gaiellaceae bacterium]|nr:ribonuclease Z [Gaiellaceae bacterium]